MQLLDEERGLFGVDVQEVGFGVQHADGAKVFVHDFATLEVFVVEVHDNQPVLGDVVQEFGLDDLKVNL
jgi:hypothetical protein